MRVTGRDFTKGDQEVASSEVEQYIILKSQRTINLLICVHLSLYIACFASFEVLALTALVKPCLIISSNFVNGSLHGE